MKLNAFCLVGLVLTALHAAGAAPPSFEGTVTCTETRGGPVTQFLYTCQGDHLRIEKAGQTKTAPINLIDLAAQKLTIVYPQNLSFVELDLKESENSPGAADFPPSMSPAAAIGIGVPAESPPPGFVSVPPPPRLSAAGMLSPIFGLDSGMPMMPPPVGMQPKLELNQGDQTKKIQGYDCTLYTIRDRLENLEIWAAPAMALFPFRHLQNNDPRRLFGPRMLEQQWAGLLLEKSLFPLEVTVKMEGAEMPGYSFKVDKIEPKKIAAADELFRPPQNYAEIDH